MLRNLEMVIIREKEYEQCKACKKETIVPEREYYYEERRSQQEKRERSQSWEKNPEKKSRTTPVDVYANEIVYNPEKEEG